MTRRSLPGRLHLQQLFTIAVALVFIGMGWAGVVDAPWWRAVGLQPQVWWHLIPLAALAAIMLLLRIRRPLLALVLGAACVVLDFSIGFNLGVLLCLSDLVYSFALRSPRRTVLTSAAAFALLSAALCGGVLLVGNDMPAAVAVGLSSIAVLLIPLWWAWEVRLGHPLWQEPDTRESLDAERHAALLQAQAHQRAEAIEAERRQMAREVHDAVSSQVSAIALTSGAVLHAAPDTDRDRAALDSIRSSSVDALDRLGEMVRLLRGTGSGYEQLLGDASWQSIIDEASAHGLRVTAPGAPPDDLPPRLRSIVLRVLRESLSNALQHGDGTADVELERRRRVLRLSVSSGLSGDATAPSLGTGTGIIAMRERVESARGQLRAERLGDRWLVDAELPIAEGDR